MTEVANGWNFMEVVKRHISLYYDGKDLCNFVGMASVMYELLLVWWGNHVRAYNKLTRTEQNRTELYSFQCSQATRRWHMRNCMHKYQFQVTWHKWLHVLCGTWYTVMLRKWIIPSKKCYKPVGVYSTNNYTRKKIVFATILGHKSDHMYA